MRLPAALLLLPVLSACLPARRVERVVHAPAARDSLDPKSEFLKVHMRDGSLLVLQEWSTQHDSGMVSGTGYRFGVLRDTVARGGMRVPIDSVVLFETNVLRKPGPSTPLTVFTAITAAMAVYCATNTKACFGSCPTFYAGDDRQILAEGFSASIAPALEATDVDRLEIAPIPSGRFVLRMTNEAYETHVIRSLRMMAFPVTPDEAVFASGNSYWRVDRMIAPACQAAEGSCSSLIAAADGVERFTTSDATNLARRETLELTFDVETAGEYAIVLTSRQTLLHTFVLYQTLSYLGTRAGETIAALSRGDTAVMRGLRNLGRTMGGIEIGRPDHDDFLTTIYETGPLASDSHLFPLGSLAAGRHKLRIRMAQGQWRIDRIAIARIAGRAQPTTLLPNGITKNGQTDPDALNALLNGTEPLVSLPGDEFRISFEMPAADRGHTVFLESRGYYLEWMREEWLREENAAKAHLMLNDPARGLRELAPAFKQWEPRMEQLFWNSRYVRH